MRTFRDLVLAPRGLEYRVQFCGPTGSDAVEAALKLARKVTGRSGIAAFTNAYHGLTLGSLAVTANTRERAVAGVPLQFVVRVPYEGYLGNEVDTISAVVKACANDPRFQFVFAGGGIRRPQLETVCREKGITNVLFRPYSSRAELGASLAEGHLGLVTQLPQTCGSIVPSKTYGIMAAGRPILYIGPRVATPARMIERFECGWQVNPA